MTSLIEPRPISQPCPNRQCREGPFKAHPSLNKTKQPLAQCADSSQQFFAVEGKGTKLLFESYTRTDGRRAHGSGADGDRDLHVSLADRRECQVHACEHKCLPCTAARETKNTLFKLRAVKPIFAVVFYRLVKSARRCHYARKVYKLAFHPSSVKIWIVTSPHRVNSCTTDSRTFLDILTVCFSVSCCSDCDLSGSETLFVEKFS